MGQIESFLVIKHEQGRLDKVLSQRVPSMSRNQLQRLIEEGHVQVNGKSAKNKYKVASGDHITITIPEPDEVDNTPQNIPLNIIYQDNDVAVICKPQGMVVHPAPGHPDGTLVNALLYHLSDLSGINGDIRPGIVHRIDKDTSGLLMVAKHDLAHRSLSQQLKDKSIDREYLALVHGYIPHEKGTIDAPIGRDPKNRKKYAVIDNGKPSITHFTVVEHFGESFTLIRCQLETGRTHQIRVHLNYIGFPLAGDPMYGPRKTLSGKGQFLHAASLGFIHPTTSEHMVFSEPIPTIFEQTLENLRRGE